MDFYDDYEERVSILEKTGIKKFWKKHFQKHWDKYGKIITSVIVLFLMVGYLILFFVMGRHKVNEAIAFLIVAEIGLIFWLLDYLFPNMFFFMKYGLYVDNPEPSNEYTTMQIFSRVVLMPIVILISMAMGLGLLDWFFAFYGY